MQTRNKAGINNPNYGIKKSTTILAKIIKLVYVYNSEDMSYIGSFPSAAMLYILKHLIAARFARKRYFI
jgi:hypothetical protein